MTTLNITDKQAQLIIHALELYTRLGLGQFDFIKHHWSIEKYIMENHKEDYHDLANSELTKARNLLFDMDHELYASWGIHNQKADESIRTAYDIRQIMRHEFWKENPNSMEGTIDSHVMLISSEETEKVKFKIENYD